MLTFIKSGFFFCVAVYCYLQSYTLTPLSGKIYAEIYKPNNQLLDTPTYIANASTKSALSFSNLLETYSFMSTIYLNQQILVEKTSY